VSSVRVAVVQGVAVSDALGNVVAVVSLVAAVGKRLSTEPRFVVNVVVVELPEVTAARVGLSATFTVRDWKGAAPRVVVTVVILSP